MNEHRLNCKCIFFIISKWKCLLTGAPRVPGAPIGPAGPDSPCEETEERQQHDQWSTEGSAWSTMTLNKDHKSIFFKFSLTLTFSPLGPAGPGGPMGPVRPWDRKKEKTVQRFFKLAGATHKKTLYSAATTTKQNRNESHSLGNRLCQGRPQVLFLQGHPTAIETEKQLNTSHRPLMLEFNLKS